MLKKRQKWILPILLVLTAVVLILLEPNEDDWGALGLLVAPSLLAMFFISDQGRIRDYLAYATCCLSLTLPVFGFLVKNTSIGISTGVEDLLFMCLFVAFLLSVLLLVGYAGLAGLSRLLRRQVAPSGVQSRVDAVSASFDSIRNNIDGIVEAVSKETSTIDRAVEDFRVVLSNQETEFNKLQEEIEAAKEEASRYKILASLSKEQQNAFLGTVRAGKRLDYIVGFVLGLLGSAIVQVIGQWIDNLK